MASSLPVLTFHAIDDRPSVISFSPARFERGMRLLHEKGYRTLSLIDVADVMRKRLSFPEHSLAITFDDGYQSVYERAFPVLQRYQMTANVFLTVGRTKTERLPSMEDRSMLSWTEIREMHRAGIAFGGHTITHPDLTRLPETLLRSEIVGGKEVIEDALGDAVVTFAYPFGRYDNRCRELTSHYFVCACSDQLGLLHSSSDLYSMERVDAYYLRTERLLSLMSSGLLPLYVKARNVPRRIRLAVQRGRK
jgi:peptidoglycan/xylan/chitin deacetylase (PgdA/CDA1 family)